MAENQFNPFALDTKAKTSEIKRNIVIAVIIIFILYSVGAFVYHYVEGWSWLDSVYFMTVTFTTVGYGDIVPRTTYGRIFTIIIIWAGISTALFLLYNLASYREAVIDRKVEEKVTKFKGLIGKIKKPEQQKKWMFSTYQHFKR